MTEPWVGTAAVAEHTNESIFTVRNRAKAGDYPAVKIGRDWMFKLSEIDAALNSKITDPWAQSPRSRSRRRTV